MPAKTWYTDAEICDALLVILDHGMDIDALPMELTVEDLILMAEGIERPN